MKRITRMAKRCAGEMSPYGNVSACSPETVAPGGARRSAGTALGERAEDDHAVGHARRHGRRRVAHRRRAAAAPAAPLHVGEAQLGSPSAAAMRDGIVAVVAVGGEAVDLRGSMPASAQARGWPGARALNSESGDWPCL
jgi:hypothetical protein